MKLVEFITKHHEEILEEWVSFARGIQPEARSMSDEELRDHAAQLLTDIAADMASPQTKHEQGEKSKGRGDERGMERVGRQHARQRLRNNFQLDELVSEYRALRASVLRLWATRQASEIVDVIRFNEAIDEALTESTSGYTAMVNRTREQFLAMLGHDLRNPLGAILMTATSLLRAEGLDEKQVRGLVRIQNSAGRMNRMVEDLLDLTRTRLGSGIPITRAPVDLAVVCRQALNEIEAVHPEADLRFDSAGDLRGDWDADRLAQVVSNLVGNAVQHGDAKSPVRIVAEGSDEEVVLTVQNPGNPIPANALATLFEPMVRLPNKAETHTTSLGLGLYIAREVVTAHGGEIDVTSTASGGTTFTVRLPRRAPTVANPESSG